MAQGYPPDIFFWTEYAELLWSTKTTIVWVWCHRDTQLSHHGLSLAGSREFDSHSSASTPEYLLDLNGAVLSEPTLWQGKPALAAQGTDHPAHELRC